MLMRKKEFLHVTKEMVKEKIQQTKEFLFTTIETEEGIQKIVEEGKNILKNINDNDYVITLEILGKELDSVSFSKLIENHYTYDSRKMVFVIGSSCGLSDEVKNRSNYKLSFSKMTFPHQLMRVIFLEQCYRAFAIMNNIKYHK